MIRKSGVIVLLIVLGLQLFLPENTFALGTINRLSGQDRYETAKVIAAAAYSGSIDNIILATGNNFADVISASVLAGKLNAPILLVNRTISQSDAAMDYVAEHLNKTGTIYLIGGSGTLGQEFSTALNDMGYRNIVRLGGIDRYETDAVIAETCNNAVSTPIFVASGENFSDALSVSSIAANKGWPILLVQKNVVPDSIRDYIVRQQPSEIYLIGGTSVIPTSIEAKLSSFASNTVIHRIAGENRYDTCAQVLQKFYSVPSTLFLATGANFPDALVGGVLAAGTNDPLVLIDPKMPTPPQKIASYLATLAGSDTGLTTFGDTSVVSDLLVNNISKIISGTAAIDDIYAIPNLATTVYVGDPIPSPATIRALLYDSTYMEVPVTWEQTDLSATIPGTNSVKGHVSGYASAVYLNVIVIPKLETYVNLKNSLIQMLGSRLSNVGVSFCDLTNGTSFSLNGGQQFLAASTYKVPLVMILYDLIAEGRLTEKQLVTFRESEYEGGTGILQYGDLSKPISYSTLAEYAIRYSDNIAAIMIQDNICGRTELLARYKALIGHDLYNGTSKVLTANDAMGVLKKLYTGADNGNIGYQKIVAWLKNTDFHDRLDRDLDHAIVAHKIGNLYGATNDIGIFYTDKPYILTVYTSNLSNPNDVIARISDMVYDYQEKYGK